MDLLERIDLMINEKSPFDKTKPSKEKCPQCKKNMKREKVDGKNYLVCEPCEINFRDR